MNRILYSILISFLLLLFGCGNPKDKTTVPVENVETAKEPNNINITNAQFENSAMELGSLSERDFPSIVQSTGMIDVPPQSKAVVSAFMGGYIKETLLLIGDKIKKGQALVTIENPDFVQIQQDYLEVSERLTFLKSEYERQKILMDEKITSQKNYLKAESDYKSALARYNGLQKKLTMLNINTTNVENGNFTSVATIFSPINGNITKLNVSMGMYTSPAEVIMEIINVDHIHLELLVFEKNILNIKKNQSIIFKIPEVSNEVFDAKVHLVGTLIDDKNRTIKVHGHLKEDQNRNFAIGMFVEAQIVTNKTIHKALPTEAIITLNNKAFVLVLSSNKNNEYTFTKVEIEVGETYDGYTSIIIKDKIKETDKFLIKGGFNLVTE